MSDDNKKPAKKDGFKKNLVGLLTYFFLFLLVILSSIISSLLVYTWKGSYSRGFNLFIDSVMYNKEIRDIYKLSEFVIALDVAENDIYRSLVQVDISLAYKKNSRKVLDEIIKRKDLIRDRILHYISTRSYDDISSGYAREMLKKNLVSVINSVMYNNIVDVYFNSFIITRQNRNDR